MSEEPLPRRAASPSDAGANETVLIETTPRLAPGQQVLSRYVLESVLGYGGKAVVWRAWDQTLGETVALKFLPTVMVRDVVAVEELKEETRRARRLTHPNIVRIHDFLQDATMAAVSMEFVDGATLAKLRLEQPGKIFSVATLAPLVAQLCAALDYAHASAKMVHRDIKPANLLLTRDGQLKIADFGIARGLTEASSRLAGTAEGTSGTLVYASPQQLMGEKPTPSDDIYAVGATLYDLLTGKPPFFRGDAHSLILQVRDRPPAPLAERRKELEMTGEAIPPEWEKTILACLAKRMAERPKSARKVGETLGLASDLPLGATAPSGKSRVRREPGFARPAGQRSTRRWIAGGAVAIVVAALGYFFRPVKPFTTETPPAPIAANSGAVITPAGTRTFTVTIDPPDAEARVSIGPNPDVATRNGKAVFINLPDGEYALTVKAAGFRTFETRVSVTAGRGVVDVKLLSVRGTLELTARPGTTVKAIDSRGKETRGTVGASGQLLMENLPVSGRYRLRLEHADCEPVERTGVEIGAEGRTKLAVEQPLAPGELRVFSVPAEAEVRIDGKVVGKTPATLKNQPSGKPLRVEVVARGYRKTEQTLTLRPKQVQTINVGTLVATVSGIEFRNLPAGFSMGSARVLIDSREMKPKSDGEVWRIDGLEAGARVVEVLNADYEPWKQTVTVEDRETAEVALQPRPKPAKLLLKVAGGPRYALFANDREIPTEEGIAMLPAGEALTLEVRAEGFKTVARSLTAKPNGTENWEVRLERHVPPTAEKSWENSLGMKFVPVPGTGVLFSIWETRVKDFEAYVKATTGAWEKFGEATHPAVRVSWDDAQAFCEWLTQTERTAGLLVNGQSYRLPSDAEWSVAVGLDESQGGTPQSKSGQIKDVYPWGTQWPPPAGAGNYDSSLKVDSFDGAAPVGSFAANRHGLHDLGGNVLEWCDDFVDGVSGPHLLRGSSFVGNSPTRLLSSFRGRTPNLRTKHIGFRCVVAVGEALSGAPAASKALPVTQRPQNSSRPEIGWRWTIPNLNLELMPIPPGTFMMGSPESEAGRLPDEGPQTRVTITQSFWLGRTEVTQREWTVVMGSNRSVFKGEELPVENVSWLEAMEFCRKLTERERNAGRLPERHAYLLPTGAQWEYACRAGTTGAYARPLDAVAWYDKNSGDTTHPVAQKEANAWGLYDMHGNVSEWSADWFGNYPGGTVSDYTGPASGSNRAFRGGCWHDDAQFCRSARRSGGRPPDRPHRLVGFRLALVPTTDGSSPKQAGGLPPTAIKSPSQKTGGAENTASPFVVEPTPP